MNGKIYMLNFLFIIYLGRTQAQENTNLLSVAFWNVENLFDTQNDSIVLDDDHTPDGSYHWTNKRYRKKIKQLSSIINQMDQIQKTSPDIIGLCEVENLEVLMDLNEKIDTNSYEIIHKNSPDRRGIDVALMYNSSKVIIQNYHYRSLKLYDSEQRRKYTRDQLLVKALALGSTIYILVNHWPSRSGGELRSKPYRRKAAELNLKLIDSIRRIDPDAIVVSMGDFNDNPTSDSFKHTLKTTRFKYLSSYNRLYNPMEILYKKGLGTLAYRGQWHLFDQFYITDNLLHSHSLRFYKALVIKPKMMITASGFYKGYPKRTFSGNTYLGGYSDHYPIIMYLYKNGS